MKTQHGFTTLEAMLTLGLIASASSFTLMQASVVEDEIQAFQELNKAHIEQVRQYKSECQ